MADPVLIADLRRLIDEETQADYTDVVLSARLDAIDGDTQKLAGTIWREKAARYAGLIDIQEGNSNRKLSQLHTQALKMSASFGVDDSGAPTTGRRYSRTRPIERQ